MSRASTAERKTEQRTKANTVVNAKHTNRGSSAPQQNVQNDPQRQNVLVERQKAKNKKFESDVLSFGEQDEVARKARELWAADRVAGRLAKAVAMLNDGKKPNDPLLLLEALAKFKDVEHDTEVKVANKREKKAAEETLRRNAMEAQRVAEEEKRARYVHEKQSAESARKAMKSERETKFMQATEEKLNRKRTEEADRRTRQVRELVDKEWEKEQQHMSLARERERERRKSARVVQERDHESLVLFESEQRRRFVKALETEQVRKEARDPQVIKALPGHPALLGGHTKNIAPYAMQLRPMRYQLRRWQFLDD